MSLAKRYLSLPQELTGSFLPPQVTGTCCGYVTLCITHILPSAVSLSALPQVSLVRVRWWGEEPPGSLFRPTLLSENGWTQVTEPQNGTMRAVAMKYPVCVRPESLLEYFHDMENLTLEVIDRESRRKFGESLFPLNTYCANKVMTAAEKLVALGQENGLCEIRANGKETNVIMGYLAVCFRVQWENQELKNDDDATLAVPNVEKTYIEIDPIESSGLLKYDDNANDTQSDAQSETDIIVSTIYDTPLSESAINCTHTSPVKLKQDASISKTYQEFDVAESNPNAKRLRQLLEKGKALHLSMEKAVQQDSKICTQEPNEIKMDDQTFQPVEMSDEALAASISSVKEERNETTLIENTTALDHKVLKELHSLMLTFQALEFDPTFVDSELRQLRTSSSVSSRFSPIEIRVSHDHIASLLQPNLVNDSLPLPEVHAFAVTTSLRKRHWQLERVSTMSLVVPTSGLEKCTSSEKTQPKSMEWFRFYVQCENLYDVERKKKRHDQQLQPRASKCIHLEGTVRTTTLFSILSEKTWTIKVELYVVERDHSIKKKAISKPSKRPVGSLDVTFAFIENEPSAEQYQGSNASQDDDILSLVSSKSSESSRKSNDASPLITRSVQTPKTAAPSFRFLHFAVLLETLSIDKHVAWNKGLSRRKDQSKRGRNHKQPQQSLEPSHVALEYVVPSPFTRFGLSSTDEQKRTITRRLQGPRWLKNSPRWRADFPGHVHVFSSSNASEWFTTKYMILEIWLYHEHDDEQVLRGLVKVPLSRFNTFPRDRGSLWDNRLPFVGVEGAFRVENPFTGEQEGRLSLRLCLGTPEQIVAFATTIDALVKLQGIVRGVQTRKHVAMDSIMCRVCGFGITSERKKIETKEREEDERGGSGGEEEKEEKEEDEEETENDLEREQEMTASGREWETERAQVEAEDEKVEMEEALSVEDSGSDDLGSVDEEERGEASVGRSCIGLETAEDSEENGSEGLDEVEETNVVMALSESQREEVDDEKEEEDDEKEEEEEEEEEDEEEEKDGFDPLEIVDVEEQEQSFDVDESLMNGRATSCSSDAKEVPESDDETIRKDVAMEPLGDETEVDTHQEPPVDALEADQTPKASPLTEDQVDGWVCPHADVEKAELPVEKEAQDSDNVQNAGSSDCTIVCCEAEAEKERQKEETVAREMESVALYDQNCADKSPCSMPIVRMKDAGELSDNSIERRASSQRQEERAAPVSILIQIQICCKKDSEESSSGQEKEKEKATTARSLQPVEIMVDKAIQVDTLELTGEEARLETREGGETEGIEDGGEVVFDRKEVNEQKEEKAVEEYVGECWKRLERRLNAIERAEMEKEDLDVDAKVSKEQQIEEQLDCPVEIIQGSTDLPVPIDSTLLVSPRRDCPLTSQHVLCQEIDAELEQVDEIQMIERTEPSKDDEDLNDENVLASNWMFPEDKKTDNSPVLSLSLSRADKLATIEPASLRFTSVWTKATKDSGRHSSGFPPRDSETERIARIMQGSVTYWMKSDSSASEDETEEDEGGYF